MKKLKILAGILFIVAITGAVYGWNEYHRMLPDTMNLQALPGKDAIALIKEFEANENLCNQHYNDKVLLVTGKVLKIEKNGDAGNVLLGDESLTAGVSCQFQAEHSREMDKIKTGDQITIKGICTGMLMDVLLVRCVLN